MGPSKITLRINGVTYNVDPATISPDSRLVDFIREESYLTGTKVSCREGGCGACVLSVKFKDIVTGHDVVRAVNSCLVPVFSCNGWNISTIESLGQKKTGLHPIQNRMVDFNGSQCGFCTPGMIMSMHSLMESNNRHVSSAKVEKILDGNICRCTGYRPILDAFKSLSYDASDEIKGRCTDMEDLQNFRCTFSCSKSNRSECSGKCDHNVLFGGVQTENWKTAFTLNELLEIVREACKTQRKYRLVAGNTGTGVFKHDGPFELYLDIGQLAELKKWTVDSTGISVGGGITLTEMIDILTSSKTLNVLPFGSRVASHLERIANVPIRNRATLAGNLMLKHTHKEFPSDVFILLETLGAKVRIASIDDDNLKMFTLLEWLQLDMRGKVIHSLLIPQRACPQYFFRSFKITRRYQNAHAYVNAGFLLKLENTENGVCISERPRIVFGGINNTFTHASGVEYFLSTPRELSDPNVMKGLIDILDKEIVPKENPIEGSSEYRKLLTKSLTYKVFLEILSCHYVIAENLKTGGMDIERKLSSGIPRLNTMTNNNSVVYGPTRKLEAPVQVTGEAEYLNDIPKYPKELIGAFVLSIIGKGKLVSMDPSEALRIPGVIAFVTANDIPNANNAMPFGFFPVVAREPIFASDEVSYAGQCLGIILAESRTAAFNGAKMVKVQYSEVEKPLVGIKRAVDVAKMQGTLESKIALTLKSSSEQDMTVPPPSDLKYIEGDTLIGGQAHFHMELQGCISVPTEDGMDIFCGSQWIDHSVSTVAGALGIPRNTINMKVRRIGGSFGARITKASGIIAACAVAANKVNRPVRLILDLETNMRLIGKRPACYFSYKVGVDETGLIGDLKASVWSDLGFAPNELSLYLGAQSVQSVYQSRNWEINIGAITTNIAANTYMRAPGTTEVIALIESIMEHIAHELGIDSLQVRMVNMAEANDLRFPGNSRFDENFAVELVNGLKKSADYENRRTEVDAFNAMHRWKKRGLAMVPVRYRMESFYFPYPIYVTISHTDGSVAVSHGGIEIGNGINTKVAQAVAHLFNIPLEMVQVKPTDSLISNNGSVTGGSWTSERCCAAAIEACNVLMARLDSVKSNMEAANPSWQEVVQAAYAANQNLSAHYVRSGPNSADGYDIWLAILAEVEVDILTGEYKVSRVDLVEDTGTSMSPAIDLGQIEGAYIMGQGLWTTEELLYDENTGNLLTDRTWTYKAPETKDIPEDFRTSLFNSVPNPKAPFGSKATGEPATSGSICVVFAIRNAIDAARRDLGNFDWVNVEGPITPEKILKYALSSSEQFVYN